MQTADKRRDTDEHHVATLTDAEAREMECQIRLAEAWKRADIHPVYPASTERVAQLLAAFEYDVDAGGILGLIQDGAFPPPPMRNGRREWHAQDIANLIACCEFRRLWKFPSPLHDPKRNAHERAFEAFKRAGRDPCELFEDFAAYDLRALLLLLTEADHRGMREALRVAIVAKLEKAGISA